MRPGACNRRGDAVQWLGTVRSGLGGHAVPARDEEAAAARSTFDVFLSHNSRDKHLVERLAEKLKRAGIEPWLDKWCLVPGAGWQEGLAEGLRASSSCAVFVGPSDLGAWAQQEVAFALDRGAKEADFRVFLVLLPGVPDQFDPTTLPAFLGLRTWVDFRRGADDERALQGVINAIRGIPLGPDVPLEPTPGVRPYRGLEVFDEEHASLFFGRDAEIQRLLEKLKGTRFLAVIGASGSGKSSLVRAGLIPSLRRSALPGSETWTIDVLTPRAHPLESLAARLLRVSPGGAMQRTLDELRTDPRTLHLATSLALADAPREARLLWVIDQFEEVFTLCRDLDEQAAFIANLLYAGSIPDGRGAVVLTMRADFYHRCLSYPELAQQLAAQQFPVSPMDESGLRQAIEEPARRAGLELEPGLVPTILEDVAEQPGALPLLEHALLELWERRAGSVLTLAGYRESGGVRRAIAARADVVFDSLTPEQQEIARRGLLRLTEPGEGTEDTRRRAELSELATDRAKVDDVEAVVQRLVDARLLTTGTEEETGEQWVDVAHEALIRGWPRLQGWIDEDRAGLRVHRRLTEAALDWEDHDREEGSLYRGARLAEATVWRERNDDSLNSLERAFLDASAALRDREAAVLEQQRRRELEQAKALAAEQLARAEAEARGRTRLRRLAVGLVVLLALAAAATVLALIERRTAIGERNRALPAQLAAQSQATLRDFPARGLLLAVEAERAAKHAHGVRVPAADAALTEALAYAGGTVLASQRSAVTASAVSHDSSRVAIGEQDGTVQLVGLGGAERGHFTVLRGVRERVASLDFSPDDRWLVVAHRDLRTFDSGDRKIRLWNLSSPVPKAVVLPGEGKRFGSVAISPDGHWLVTVSTTDRTVRLWDLTAAVPASSSRVLAGPRAQQATAAISPSGRWLVLITGRRPHARLWNLTTGGSTAVPGTGAAIVSDAPNAEPRTWRRLAVVAHSRGMTTVLDLSVDQPVRYELRSPEGRELDGLASSRDGRWLIGASAYQLWAWRLNGSRAGRPIALDSQGAEIESITISPNSRWLAITGSTQAGDGLVLRVWNLDSSRRTGIPVETGFGVPAASPDSRWLAVVDPRVGILHVLDLTGSETEPFTYDIGGYGGNVTNLFVTSDNRWLVAGIDKTVRLLDLRALCPYCDISSVGLHGHDGQVASVIASPNLRYLVTISSDRTTRLWNLPGRAAAAPSRPLAVTDANRSALIARACEISGRNLTENDEWRTYFPDKRYRKTCPEFPPA